MIDWASGDTEVLLNPRLPRAESGGIHEAITACGALPAHVWVTTSGSTGRLKPVALAKQALLAAAEAVNTLLEATRDDIWCRPLPAFHVGGLGIHARAHLTGSAVFTLDKWDPFDFHALVADESVTLTSLVPTQVRDLLAHNLSGPPSLRHIILGGGAAAPGLVQQAHDAGWPLIPSYGATETCAAIAFASSPPSRLRVLSFAETRLSDDGRLAFRSPALLTGYAGPDGLQDPKTDGWWISEDLGTVAGDEITVTGRADDVVKVGGESVSLGALQARLEELLPAEGITDAAVIAVPDERLGAVVRLVAVGSRGDAEELQRRWNDLVLPFERARDVQLVEAIPRTELGKVRRASLP